MDLFELGPDVISVLLTCGTCLHLINVSKYDRENKMSPFLNDNNPMECFRFANYRVVCPDSCTDKDTLKLGQQLRRLNLMSSPWIMLLFLTKPPRKSCESYADVLVSI